MVWQHYEVLTRDQGVLYRCCSGMPNNGQGHDWKDDVWATHVCAYLTYYADDES